MTKPRLDAGPEPTDAPRDRAVVVPLRRPSTDLADIGDEAVIAACATGDPIARAALFQRHVAAVHRFVARLCYDAATVDDLVQSTFIAAYRAAPRFRAGGRARPWLFGIAANLSRSHIRREGRRVRALTAIASLQRDEPAVELDPARRDRIARLPAAIAALSHDLRAALVLVDLEGESGREAATALGVPEGTLWRRVFVARRAVRKFVDGGER
jgi:RNA polymerase sigma-70 factor (ECF subfamily)